MYTATGLSISRLSKGAVRYQTARSLYCQKQLYCQKHIRPPAAPLNTPWSKGKPAANLQTVVTSANVTVTRAHPKLDGPP